MLSTIDPRQVQTPVGVPAVRSPDRLTLIHWSVALGGAPGTLIRVWRGPGLPDACTAWVETREHDDEEGRRRETAALLAEGWTDATRQPVS